MLSMAANQQQPPPPEKMLALAIHRFCTPKDYDIATVPTPRISQPDDVLIRVDSASINPGELVLASGLAKMVMKDIKFPWKIGYDVSGTVIAVGTSVTSLKPGDEVYSKVPEKYRGSVASYVLSISSLTAKKPQTLDLSTSAAVPLAAITALMALERGNEKVSGGLRGKTVFIPAGLSGTGHFAIQMARNVFGCEKIITTLSTGKVKIFEGRIGGKKEGYQIVDYTKVKKLDDAIVKASVDFMLDTKGLGLTALPVMKKGGVIVTISSTTPSGTAIVESGMSPPILMVWLLNVFDWLNRTRATWSGVDYSSFFAKSSARDLERLATWVDEGKLVPVVGEVVKMSDVEAVRRGCQMVFDGKGGVGKFVIHVDS